MRKSSHRKLGADVTVLVQCRDLKLVSSRDWSCGHLLRESIAVGLVEHPSHLRCFNNMFLQAGSSRSAPQLSAESCTLYL